MASLNALSGIVRSNRDRFLNVAARRYQTLTGSSARYNALELLLIHVGDALGSSEATLLERWVQREVRDIPAVRIVDSLRAVSFAILDAIESQRELFDVALLRLGHLEKRVAETAHLYERRTRTFVESTPRSAACEAILALAASFEPQVVTRRRTVARLAESIASELAFSTEAIGDVRDAALLAVLHDIDRFGIRLRPSDVAVIAPLAGLAKLLEIQADSETRTDLERLWERNPGAVVLVTAADAVSWPDDGVTGYLRGERSLTLPAPVRAALERVDGTNRLAFDGGATALANPAGPISAHF